MNPASIDRHALPMQIIYSNDQQRLANALADFLFSADSSLFEKRIVVVPHLLMKDFIFSTLEKKVGIAAGVQVFPLNQAVMEILGPSSKRIPSFVEMSLAIQELLQMLCQEETFAFRSYLRDETQKISSFSDELTRCFTHYGLYGSDFLHDWLAKPGPQQTVWKRLFSQASSWTYPIEFLKNTGVFSGKVALFGFSSLAPAYLSFFSQVSAALFQLSPCALFWEDCVSDKERIGTKKFFIRKGGSEKAVDELDNFLRQGHPLLKRWGKWGKEMLRHLDAFLLFEKEMYEDNTPQTLLGSIQSSLLHLEEPFLSSDDSIQIHSAPSKLREVEALRDTLETLMHTSQSTDSPLRPSDIVIASPDIAGYAPYIKMVFSQSVLPYRIEGLPLKNTSKAVRGFLQLLELPNLQYDLSSVLALFQNACFLEKSGFSSEEISQIFTWLKAAQVKKGINSWEEGIDRLLYGLARIPGEEDLLDPWPLSCIPLSKIDLFNRFLLLFSRLKHDLAQLNSKKTVHCWLSFFVAIADAYLVIAWDKEPFFKELRGVAISSTTLVWDYESIRRVIDHLAKKAGGSIASRSAECLHFVALSSGTIKTARVIGCLGMNEAIFPRPDVRSSLFEMDAPLLKTDEDRYTFLELFLKAKEYLILSYLRIHPEDGKCLGPSLLIEELVEYMQECCIFTVDHPVLPFDPVYFEPNAPIKKWSEIDMLAARAQQLPKHPPSPFFSSQPQDFPQSLNITTRQLKALARHPLQFYLNEKLKIFLNKEEDEEEAQFLLSPLQKALLRREALAHSLSRTLHKSQAQGKLPQGLFHDLARNELEEEVNVLLSALNNFGLKQDQLLSQPLPQMMFNVKGVSISLKGELDNVTPEGLLVLGEANIKTLAAVWPLYLLYRMLNPQNRFLLFAKKEKKLELPISDPESLFVSYLEYFLLARQMPSPLMPQWVKDILEGKEFVVRDTDDPYLSYLKRLNAIPKAWDFIPLGFRESFHAL